VRGVTTNMPHVRSCIANPDFKRGRYDTSFIPKYYGGPGAAAGCLRAAAAAAAATRIATKQVLQCSRHVVSDCCDAQ
jgi:acetyl/propionyl-CoA carboxylase alpha subunit